jgi:polysaccharide pyruvyl transferase CsaB
VPPAMAWRSSTLLCGYFGEGNWGDEAMLAGLLAGVTAERRARVIVMSGAPERTRQLHGVAAVKRRDSRGALWSLALRSRTFALGGGDLIRETEEVPVVTRWLPFLDAPLATRMRTAVVGVSVGTLVRGSTRDAVRRYLDRVDLVAVRDRRSAAKLEALGVSAPITVAPDLSFGVLQGRREAGAPADSGKHRIAVNVRHLWFRPRVAGATDAVVQDEMVRFLDGLSGRPDVEIHLVPFRTTEQGVHPFDDDRVCALRIAARCRNGHRLVVHEEPPGMGGAADFFRGFDCVVGMRLHSLVLAACAGTPFLALGYDDKVADFAAEVGLSEQLVEIRPGMAATLLEQVEALLAEVGPYRTRVSQGLRDYLDRYREGSVRLEAFLNG